MNHFMKKLPLKIKLLVIGIIPFFFLVYLTIQVYQDKTQKLKLFDNYKTYMNESANISGLIDALQEERKFSFDYAMTKSMKQQLVLQRPVTNDFLNKLLKSDNVSITGLASYTRLGELTQIRNKIDSFKIGPDAVMHFYSNTIFRLNTLNTIPPANTPYLRSVYKDLVTQKLLSEMITYLGIIRSNIYNVLHTRKYMIETMIGTVGTHDVYNSYELELLAKASPEATAEYKTLRNSSALKPTVDYIDSLFKRFAFDSSYTAAEWWKVSDEGSNNLRKFQSRIWFNLNEKINNLYEIEKNARTKTLILLIIAFTTLIVVGTYITAIISRDLIQLRTAAEKISNGENYLLNNIETRDVIGSLAKSILKINSNNQQLSIAAMEIGKGNYSVGITARSEADVLGNAIMEMRNNLEQYSQKMELLVNSRTEALKRSNDDLQEFAYVASHDLKEPLRKIATFSRFLSTDASNKLTDKGQMYLHKIEHSSRRMSDMIDGVLAYSTINVVEQRFEQVDLNMIIGGVKNDLELAILQKDATIVCGKLPSVRGIPLLLQQLFYNLVNNALKFTIAGKAPAISISAAFTNDPVVNEEQLFGSFVNISVCDNGIGFDRGHAAKMFGVFFRIHSKDKYEGTGLGLALCKKIVLRHKGDIYAVSEEGKGAAFHILLPFDPSTI
ncbi:MAG: ATP-binding protein [Ferruginibacter sp.]